jgi:hypothetical protein
MERLDNGMDLMVYGEDCLLHINSKILIEIAECYAEVFNESWNEEWTVKRAVSSIRKSLTASQCRIPLLSLLYHEERMAGFSWLVLTDRNNIAIDDMPFGVSKAKKNYGREVIRYWCDLAKNSRLIIFRDVGVKKEFRNDPANKNLGSMLELAVIQEAVKRGYRLMFHWTSPQSAIFNVGISLGNHPICFFPREERIILKGNAMLIARYLDGVLKGDRAVLREIYSNKKRYFCRDK